MEPAVIFPLLEIIVTIKTIYLNKLNTSLSSYFSSQYSI